MSAGSRSLAVLTFVIGLAPSASAQGLQNIAPLGIPSQSSEYNGGQFPANLALDGNFGNFTHTAAGNNGSAVVWWQLDFGDSREFEQIIIHNRGGVCCQSRLRDITVFVLSDPNALADALLDDPLLTVEDLPDVLDDVLIFESELLNPENATGGGGTAGPLMIDAGLDEVIEGQVVVVTRTPDPDLSGTGGQGNNAESDVLSIGEIEIFGSVECPKEGDTHCTGLEVVPPLEGGPGLYTVNATGEDDNDEIVFFTFTFEGPNGELVVVGPTATGTGTAQLGPGEWTVSVLADDGTVCDDLADDAECFEEIEVAQSENLALGKPTQQSSQLGDFAPGLGVDGNRGNFTHTAAGQNLPATWQVDLVGEFDISFVNVFNRVSCCGSRLRDITVQILDDDLSTVLFETPLMNPENVLGLFPLGPANLGVDLVHLTGDTVAGFGVRLVRTPDPDNSGVGGQGNNDEANVLAVGEVEVYGARSACPEEGDTHCEGVVVTPPLADGPGLFTFEIQGSDDSGDALTYSAIAENATGDVAYVGHSDNPVIELFLGEGHWTVRCIVDDDPRCSDQADDAVCEETIEIGDCTAGDTHCEDLVVEGPDDSGPSVYTFTALADDDSLDPILYRFSRQLDGAEESVSPLQELDSVVYFLGPGTWTIRVLAVDSTTCLTNEAADALCETLVEVEDGGENVALGKATDQTSTLNFFLASLAVDGDLANFTHTFAGNDALGPAIWEVDLDEAVSIGRILVHNRDSCCTSRLRDIIVSVHDVSFREDELLDPLINEAADAPSPLWEDALFESDLLNEENGLGGGGLVGPEALQVDLTGEGVVGRYIRVTRLPDLDLSGTAGVGNLDESTVLSIGELQVFLDGGGVDCPQEGDAEFGDTECSQLAASGPAGNVAGTWTFTATATDGTGDTVRYTFVAESDGGSTLSSGPTVGDNTADFDLTVGTWTVTVTVDDDRRCDDEGASTECSTQVVVVDENGGPIFRRGDADDNGQVQLTDAIAILGFLFQGTAPPPCFDSADADNNGQVQLTDAIAVLGFLFQGTAPPPAPGPTDCGEDPDDPADAIDCQAYASC
jgi:hypothetical protein